MTKLNILYLQKQPCARGLKLGDGGINKGSNIYFAYQNKTLTGLYGYGDELFQGFTKLPQDTYSPEFRKALREVVRRYDINLIHSHNTPDTLTCAAILELGKEIPIIHDTHDILSIRPHVKLTLKSLAEEFFANTYSSGNLYVTEGVRELLERRYPLTKKRKLVFPNYVPSKIIPSDSELEGKISEEEAPDSVHIVYEGSLNALEGSHRDLRQIFEEIASLGIHVHIFAPRDIQAYKDLAAKNPFMHYEGSLPLPELMKRMSAFDFGWAGFNTSTQRAKQHMDTALANKIFEYVASGIPAISFPHEIHKRVIEWEDIGFCVDDIRDIPTLLRDKDKIDRIKTNVLRKKIFF